MNIFKLLIHSIKLKLCVIVAKRYLQVIKYLMQQKEPLLEILTNYEVENKLVELKAPVYEYYKSRIAIPLEDVLKNEISENDIPTDVNEIKYIKTPFEFSKEGYYCMTTKNYEYFAISNGEKHPLQELPDGLPYTELFTNPEKDTELPIGYYKRTTVVKKYYHAVNKIFTTKIKFNDIPETEHANIKLIQNVSDIVKEGYYKVIV